MTSASRGPRRVSSTGAEVIGPQPIATFEEIIDERLEAARRLVAVGVPPEKVYEKTTEGGTPHFAEDC